MQLINIGFGNMVSSSKLIAIVSPESAPIKRIIQDARDKGMLIDATYGRRTPGRRSRPDPGPPPTVCAAPPARGPSRPAAA